MDVWKSWLTNSKKRRLINSRFRQINVYKKFGEKTNRDKEQGKAPNGVIPALFFAMIAKKCFLVNKFLLTNVDCFV